jgi:outer membrane protein OmpA-like peptidoglycan-associated protein
VGDNWTLVIPGGNALTHATYSIVVTVTDGGANSTADATTNELVVDTASPTAPTVTSQTSTSATPSITGSYPSSDAAGGFTVVVNSVTYTLGVDAALTAVSDNWTLVIPGANALADITYSVVATATDGAGNTAADATSNELVIDTTPPTVPTVTSQISSSTTPTITGTYPSSDSAGGFTVVVNSVTYTLGVDAALTAVSDNWTLVIPGANALSATTYSVVATATDGAGNTAVDATSNELVIDTTPPTVPTVTSQTSSSGTPTITGTYPSSDSAGGFTVVVNSVTYTLGADAALTAVGDNWTLVIPGANALAATTYSVVATATDGAGNTSADATSNELVIDTTPPAVPTVTSQTSNSTTPTITGTYPSSDSAGGFTVVVNSVTYTLGVDAALTAVSDNWTLVIPGANALAATTYSVVATATDGAGNTAADATSNELVIDTTPPAVPTVTSQTSSSTTPTITGTYPSSDSAGGFTVVVNSVTYTLGVDAALTAIGDNWTLVIPGANALAATTYSVVATATDGAGNTAADATSNELVIDTTPPAVPTVTSQTSSSGTPTITGTYPSSDSAGGFTVVINSVTYTLGVDAALTAVGSNWTLVITAGNTLADATYPVVATATDGVGNSAADATNNELVVNSSAPTSPTVNSQTSNTSTPSITGTYPSTDAAGGFTVLVNSVTYTLGVDAELTALGNNWTLAIPLANALSDTTYSIVATVTNGGSVSSADNSNNELIVDTASPTAPTVTSQTSNSGTPSLTGTYPSSDSAGGFTVQVNSVTYTLGVDAELTAVGSNWTLVIPGANTLPGATYTVVATVTDGAGNSTADATSNELIVDTVAATTTSTIAASPTSITADGSATSVITVQLKFANGTNLGSGGDAVILSTSLGTLSALGVANDVGDGTYTVTLTSATTMGTATITGTLNGTAMTNSATVTFTAGVATTANSSITASPTSITADGSSTSVITVQLKDSNDNNLSSGSGTVVLNTSAGSLGAVTDNSNGTYTATLTSASTAGTATITATLNAAAITDTATVTFTASVSASSTTSSITASVISISADGSSTSIITVQLKDASGNNLSSGGDSVALSTNAGSLAAVSDVGDGTYTAILTSSTTASVATITGTINSSAMADTATVTFTSSLDSDGDGIADIVDLDDDNDGIPDSLEGNGLVDTDGDGIVDSLDLDSDNDGLFDLVESGVSNPAALDTDNDGRIDTSNSVGTNGLADTVETFTDSGILNYNSGAVIDTDGDGVSDFRDLDSDNDGIPDVTESGGSDPDGDGILGSGTPTVDSNGLATGSGLTPIDSDGDGIGDQLELDSDNDGINDLLEAGGNDADNDGLVDGFSDNNGDGFDDGITSTSLPLTDSDGDSTPDYQDNDDTDNDGIPDSIDLDDDNDGIPDSLEGDGQVDTDGDGIVDSRDLDSDNDGVPDLIESGVAGFATLDTNNDGRIDNSNSFGANGLADDIETSTDSGTINYNNGAVIDTDADGVADFRDLDSDGDGLYDLVEAGGTDTDNNGRVDGFTDANNDGFDDTIAGRPLSMPDTDGDGIADRLDLDSDNDGIMDVVESGGSDPDGDGLVGSTPQTVDSNGVSNEGALVPRDTDGDGVYNQHDLDSDNDSIADVIEAGGSDADGDGVVGTGLPTVDDQGIANNITLSPADTDGDGSIDAQDLDADNDGLLDLVEAGNVDSNGDGLIDNFTDADNNGFDDPASSSLQSLTDSDGDSIPDYLDITENTDVIRTAVDGVGAFDFWLLMLLAPLVLLRRTGAVNKSNFFLCSFLLPILLNQNLAVAGQDKEEPYERRLYIGGGIGYSLMVPETGGTSFILSDDKDFGYKMYVGLDLTEHFSSELSLSDLGTAKLNPSAEIDYSITAFNALYYLYDQGENNHEGWALYLKGGLGSIKNSANVSIKKEHSLQVSMGGGIEYGWNNNFAARLDFESFDDDASLLTIGLLYRFGKKEEKKPQPKDTDGDGVYDDQDMCPETLAGIAVSATGCELDTDKDGVYDSEDQCPLSAEKATVNELGCDKDSDGDGVYDDQDQCPTTPEGTEVDALGCELDTDKDGVVNKTDECPNTILGASVNVVGCAIFETKIEGINFKVGSAELTDSSKAILDQAAEALLKFVTVRIEIQAHTDSQGREKSNQRLSDARAKSVADYLEFKGVKRDRMESKGYGENQPAASNETAEGRAQNRRVEFRVLEDSSGVE